MAPSYVCIHPPNICEESTICKMREIQESYKTLCLLLEYEVKSSRSVVSDSLLPRGL